MRRFLVIISLVLLLCAAVTTTGCSSEGALFTYEDENGPVGPQKVQVLPLGFRRSCVEPCPEPKDK